MNIEQFKPNCTKYFQKMLDLNGQDLQMFQTSHIMIIYFLIHGLDMQNSLSNIESSKIISFISSLQIPNGGFTSSLLYTGYTNKNRFFLPHIIFTYSAVNCLAILDSLQVVNKKQCLESVKKCQKSNGSYSSFQCSEEADLRFVYAAVSICNLLKDFSILNRDKIIQYVNKCRNFDGGYGIAPGYQSHSGAIYCAVSIFKHLNVQIPENFSTVHFLVRRQTVNQTNQNIVGTQGRVGKMPDSCYSFWIGASLQMLTGKNLLNSKVQNFLQLCYNNQKKYFSKYPKNKGDPLHSLHATSGLRIIRNKGQLLQLAQGILKKHIN